MISADLVQKLSSSSRGLAFTPTSMFARWIASFRVLRDSIAYSRTRRKDECTFVEPLQETFEACK